MSESEDIGTLGFNEIHPAARSAYRWLKGFMITNQEEYLRVRTALEMAAISGNRQAQVSLGTIDRLKNSEVVSDRYLLGLAWTILYVHNFEAMESVADRRLDSAYPKDETELQP